MNTKILIIDAHPVYVLRVTGILESLTFKNIQIAPGASRALEMIKDYNPDIIVLSATLPDGNSLDLLKTIKKSYPEISVIVQKGLLVTQEITDLFKAAGASFVIDRREKDWTPLESAIMELSSKQNSLTKNPA